MTRQETRTAPSALPQSGTEEPPPDLTPWQELDASVSSIERPSLTGRQSAPQDQSAAGLLEAATQHSQPQESQEFSESLARLERTSRQVKLYLDSIEEKIARMEPRIDAMHTSASPLPDGSPSATTSAPILPVNSALPQAGEPAVPPVDRRRRRNDVPEERRRSSFAAPVEHEPEEPWSLRSWLRAHRRWTPVALIGLITLAALLFWNTGPHPNSSTPAAAPGGTYAPTISKTSAGTPLDASNATRPAVNPGATGIGNLRRSPVAPGEQTALAPTNAAGSPTSTSAPTGALDPSTAADSPTPSAQPADRPDAADPSTVRPANSSTPTRSTRASAVPAPGGKLHVSSGVMAANLISSRAPVYPGGLAGIFHVEGTVILQAIISKSGRVVNLRVISGHRILRGAAKDAVSTWRYRPYTVNGSPVEVATIVSVDFHR